MPSVTVTGKVRRRIDDVFAFLADTRNDVQWAPLVAWVEQVEGDGPGLGAVYRVGQRGGPRTVPVEFTVSTFEPPNRLAWTAAQAGASYVGTVELAADGDATRITQTNTLTVAVPGAGRIWQAGAHVTLRAQMRRLARVLERAG